MANVTKILRDLHTKFPVGTSVSIFKRVMRDGVWVPTGAAVATASVQADGTVTLANVPDDGAGYVVVGTGVSGQQLTVQTGVGGLSWAGRH